MASPRSTPEQLFRLRPTAYAGGWKAFHTRAARSTVPYRSTRGGYRNAWLLGWDDAEKGIDRRIAPRDT